jgi:hypothetical protein
MVERARIPAAIKTPHEAAQDKEFGSEREKRKYEMTCHCDLIQVSFQQIHDLYV